MVNHGWPSFPKASGLFINSWVKHHSLDGIRWSLRSHGSDRWSAGLRIRFQISEPVHKCTSYYRYIYIYDFVWYHIYIYYIYHIHLHIHIYIHIHILILWYVFKTILIVSRCFRPGGPQEVGGVGRNGINGIKAEKGNPMVPMLPWVGKVEPIYNPYRTHKVGV